MSAIGRVAIVGGGIAGVATAAALRRGGYGGEVHVFDDSATYPYDRPPLSKGYLTGRSDLGAIALQQPEWYQEQRIQLMTPVTVTSVKPADEHAVVWVDTTAHVFDWVVLATGGHAARPPIPGAESARVLVLREHGDADALRTYLAPGRSLMIVGGGLIGAEVASTARELGAEVVLVDPLDPPLSGAVGQETAAWLHSLHSTHGVRTVVGSVSAFEERGDGLDVALSDGTTHHVDAVLLGVGMVSEASLAEAAGLEVEGGILTDADQVTSHPRVLAVGDAARARGQRRTEQWEAAQKDAERAAAVILSHPVPEPAALWFWSDRYGHHVEGVGDMAGGEHVVRGMVGEPPFAVFNVVRDDCTALVRGAVSVDDSTSIRVARRLIDRALVVSPSALADLSIDLRKLLKR